MLRPLLLGLLLATCVSVSAHDGLDLLPPISAPEAWNAMELCAANVDKLVVEQQWKEIPLQISLMGQSARFFRDHSEGETSARWNTLEQQGIFVIRAALERNGPQVQELFQQYRTQLAVLEKEADPKVVQSQVYSCPMCRNIRELDPKTECFKCGMALVPRVIPASSVYNTPGEPSVLITPKLQPLVVGQPANVTIHLSRKKDGGPMIPDDLLIVHTERIHLLIVDESLSDYHHEHPLPAGAPGDYSFTFTPRKPGNYRVFADIVPRVSNVQEYAVCDLPATAEKGEPVAREGSPATSSSGGIHFELAWNTGGVPLRAKQPINAGIMIRDAEGKPFTQLEPVMGAYAHLVSFHEDRQTVLHIHPLGAEPTKPEDRGGPKFSVRFWAPKPGFYRLYLQVQVGGKQVFAPFALNIEP